MSDFLSWKIGEVTVTCVPEFADWPLATMLEEATDEALAPFREALAPNFMDESGMLRIAIQSFVIDSGGRRILVDGCLGNGKQRRVDRISNLRTDYLERLSAVFPAESFDMVICTHMHTDHVGWNTRLQDGVWVPTFQNATYLFSAAEWENAQKLDGGDSQRLLDDSVRPLVAAGVTHFIETPYQMTDEVSVFATPGHTPGHVSVAISSGQHRAVITGDSFHHPIQVARPQWCARIDDDPAQSAATRHRLLEQWRDSDLLVIGTHFRAPTAGHIVSTPDGQWFHGV